MRWRQELRTQLLWLGCLLEPGLEVVVELEKCARWLDDLLVWGGLRWDVLLGLKVRWTLSCGDGVVISEGCVC